ncbi:hypothetical protein F5Y07DRAFT_38603 [Xylaria sp. FL0933]|nr:hypothetical protein F5Y07DRAFT_38603 [Xylaria sp. FL0933]
MSGAPPGSGGGGSQPPKQSHVPVPIMPGQSGYVNNPQQTPSGQRTGSRLPGPIKPSRAAAPMIRPSTGNVHQMQPHTPSRGQLSSSSEITPTQATVSGQTADPFATPRNPPAASGSATRGGALMKGSKKAGQKVEDVYPQAFYPICRDSYNKVADRDSSLRIFYTWEQDPDSPSAVQATRAKNIIDREVRKIILVYSSNKLMCSLIKALFPDINTSSQTFNQYRVYAMETFANFKHEILWENAYDIAVSWYKDFGKDKFRIDPTQGHDTEAIKKQTKDWIYTQLEDSKVFKHLFRPVWQVIDYDATYGDKKDLPFYHYKVIAHTILIAVGRVYLAERQLNRKPDGTYVTWHRGVKAWRKSKDSREKVSDTFEALSAYKYFTKMELENITWIDQSQREEASKRRASQLLEEAVISDSPPPEARAKQARHQSPDIYGASPTRAGPSHGSPSQSIRQMTGGTYGPPSGHRRQSSGSQHSRSSSYDNSPKIPSPLATSTSAADIGPIDPALMQRGGPSGRSSRPSGRTGGPPPPGTEFEITSRPSSSSMSSPVSDLESITSARQRPSQQQEGSDGDHQLRRSSRIPNLRGRNMEFDDVFGPVAGADTSEDGDDEVSSTDETLDDLEAGNDDVSSMEMFLEQFNRGRAGFY